MSDELWFPIRKYEGLYEVSNTGRVRSVSNPKTKHRGIVLKQHRNPGGYPQVTLKRNGSGKTFMVHQLVAHAFIGPQGSGIEVRHRDGVQTDCRVENLEYGTRSDNVKDMIRHGTHRFGKTHCKHGHEFTPENTYNYGRGRVCKTCQSAANRHCYQTRKARNVR